MHSLKMQMVFSKQNTFATNLGFSLYLGFCTQHQPYISEHSGTAKCLYSAWFFMLLILQTWKLREIKFNYLSKACREWGKFAIINIIVLSSLARYIIHFNGSFKKK